MKKLVILLVSLAIGFSAVAQNVVTLSVTAAGTYLVTTNRLKVYSIETGTTNAVTFKFWDNDNTNNVPTSAAAGFWGTNFVNGAYVTRSTFATNYSVIITNAYGFISTNTYPGLWTSTTTNAASTNAMTALAATTTAGAETRVSYVDALFTRGVVLTTTGNGTVTLYYRTE